MPKKAIRRAVSLVSLTAADPTKPSSSKASRLEYNIVTQVFLCLTPELCNINSVSDLVTRQVGFPVILLDSKCYPLSDNSGTTGIDFWKSSRKILTASKSLYEEITGHNTTIDSNLEAIQPPPAKKQRQEDVLLELLEKVTAIDKKVSLPSELSKALQCSICKGVASQPVVSSCCQRVVACLNCNRTWLLLKCQPTLLSCVVLMMLGDVWTSPVSRNQGCILELKPLPPLQTGSI